MKNVKEFDYNKQKPNTNKQNNTKKSIPKPTSKPSNFNTDYDDIEIEDPLEKEMNNPYPLIKGIETKNQKEQKKIITTENPPIKKSSTPPQNIETEKENDDIELNIIEPELPDSEILQPDIPFIEDNKKPNVNFTKNLLNNMLKNSETSQINNNIMNGVENGLNNIMSKIETEINDNHLKINDTQININNKNDISNVNNKTNIESSIKLQKIRELNTRRKNLEKQINKIDENLKIFKEERNLNSSNRKPILENPTSKIDENIKKSQLKESKQTKEVLISKLNNINEQVQKLMQNEEELAQIKKVNVKDFLENFEKDKLKAAEMVKKYSEEKKIREKKMMDNVNKCAEKREKEFELLQIEEENKKKQELEKIRMKELERIRLRNKENSEKLNQIRAHAKDKTVNENKYLFKVLENKYKQKTEKEIKIEIMKHREKMKEGCITREEILDFEKKQKELELRKLAEAEEEKKKLKEQWKMIKENLPKFESSTMQKVKQEEEQLKEKKEMEELKKKVKFKETKNYGENVQKLFLPKINENIKKEREERIKNLNTKNNIQKLQKKKNNGRVLLVKPDPNKPKKYGWKLKLEPLTENKYNTYKENENLRSKSADKDKHKPLEKLPDYLTMMRLEKKEERSHKTSQVKYRGNNWEKMMKDGNIYENVEFIKQKASELENKAKMNERLLNSNNKKENEVELQQKVSNYLIDAIKAKLTILNNINQP